MDWTELAAAWNAQEIQIEAAHAPIRRDLLERAGVQAGERVLDIGCGSGALSLDAAQAVGPTGQVTGLDIAQGFVARLEERAAGLTQVTPMLGDAQSHDFGGAQYHAVLSLFGMMFFDDPARAFANIAQSLTPGGRIVFVTWAGPQHNPWFSVPGRAMAAALPDKPPPDPSAPGPMAFADQKMVTGLLSGAGLKEVRAEEVDTHLTPVGNAEDVTAMMLAIGPFRGKAEQFAPPGEEARALEAIRRDMIGGYSAFAGGDGVQVPGRVIFYSAVKAG